MIHNERCGENLRIDRHDGVSCFRLTCSSLSDSHVVVRQACTNKKLLSCLLLVLLVLVLLLLLLLHPYTKVVHTGHISACCNAKAGVKSCHLCPNAFSHAQYHEGEDLSIYALGCMQSQERLRRSRSPRARCKTVVPNILGQVVRVEGTH